MSLDCDTNTSSRIGNSLSRQPVIGNRKTLVALPNYVDGRHAHVFELQLSGVVRATERMHDAAHMETRIVGIYDKTGDTPSTFATRARED